MTVCLGCDAPVAPPRSYCTDRCKWRTKAERRRRAAGAKARTWRGCDVDDCPRKHYALGLCRRDYKAARGASQSKTETVIMSTASLHGAYFPKPKPIKVRVAVGVLAECPACHSWMGALSPTSRVCAACGTTVELNAEEVSWAIYEKRSTEASRATANSSQA